MFKNSDDAETKDLERLPLYGPLKFDDFDTYLTKAKERFEELYEKSCPFIVKPDDFNIISVLGQGAFGKVLLVREKKGEAAFYAMKALEKRHISKMNQVQHALNEKRILQCIDFPFGVRMEYFAKDNSYIYFIMPFISGGEMFNHLQKTGKFSEKAAMFYAAQVVLGLEYLHHLSLVYRDLKPENILFDHFGYVKITDFGFTKSVLTRTYTFCGTPHYLAPEVISGHGYGHSVDWWSLGVLIFEMNAGFPPFNANDQMAMFRLILQNRYKCPPKMNAPLKDIIEKLLQPDVTRRIGNLRRGARDIKDHEWFKPIDWLAVFNRRIAAPFVPTTSGHGDVTHYDAKHIGKISLLKHSDTNQFEEEFKDF